MGDEWGGSQEGLLQDKVCANSQALTYPVNNLPPECRTEVAWTTLLGQGREGWLIFFNKCTLSGSKSKWGLTVANLQLLPPGRCDASTLETMQVFGARPQLHWPKGT